jgi:hypothetical protein
MTAPNTLLKSIQIQVNGTHQHPDCAIPHQPRYPSLLNKTRLHILTGCGRRISRSFPAAAQPPTIRKQPGIYPIPDSAAFRKCSSDLLRTAMEPPPHHRCDEPCVHTAGISSSSGHLKAAAVPCFLHKFWPHQPTIAPHPRQHTTKSQGTISVPTPVSE